VKTYIETKIYLISLEEKVIRFGANVRREWEQCSNSGSLLDLSDFLPP